MSLAHNSGFIFFFSYNFKIYLMMKSWVSKLFSMKTFKEKFKAF